MLAEKYPSKLGISLAYSYLCYVLTKVIVLTICH